MKVEQHKNSFLWIAINALKSFEREEEEEERKMKNRWISSKWFSLPPCFYFFFSENFDGALKAVSTLQNFFLLLLLLLLLLPIGKFWKTIFSAAATIFSVKINVRFELSRRRRRRRRRPTTLFENFSSKFQQK